ncbi:MAG TPA: energy-dependent translational throttle protein EttA [Thermoanaerobaculia bacterium]|jgi:ATP-binding cassette ChvD family protein|nr:energy-dependent translational throttle protein EttA [Thermoanaerobaculia bacterium]
MAEQYIYVMKDLRKIYPPNREVLKGIWLSFFPGAKIGVLGLNGAGKSTLLRIMAGEVKDFGGEAWAAKGTRVGYLSQEPRLDESKDVRGNVEEGVAETRALLDRYDEINAKFGEPMTDDEMEKLLAEQGRVQDQIDAVNAWEIDRTLEIAMDALRLPPADADVAKLSGGERRRVALCRLLLQKPDLLLLDEPTNHLDAESVAWLERHLAEYAGTVVAVTHDRYFLDNVAGWILELDRGQGIPWQGNYSSWLEQKSQRLEQEEKSESARRRTLERELDWVRMAPRARQAKGKARLNQYERLLSEEREYEKRADPNEIHIPPGPRLGDVVVETKNLRKGYGDNLLIEDLTFALPPGGIVGVIGPNGAGKTTLFRMIVGQEQPDSGTLRMGDTVKVAYVDQSRESLDGEKLVWEAISDGRDVVVLGNREVPARSYAAAFNFKGSDQQKRVKDLSGGERNRLHLARTLKAGGNLLLLDEPTNDLDVDTLRALEEALLAFAGCAVVISHDRWFLDRIATHILAFEGESQVVWFEGNYQAYEEDRHRRLGAEADQPHRIKYKRLTAA